MESRFFRISNFYCHCKLSYLVLIFCRVLDNVFGTQGRETLSLLQHTMLTRSVTDDNQNDKMRFRDDVIVMWLQGDQDQILLFHLLITFLLQEIDHYILWWKSVLMMEHFDFWWRNFSGFDRIRTHKFEALGSILLIKISTNRKVVGSNPKNFTENWLSRNQNVPP